LSTLVSSEFLSTSSDTGRASSRPFGTYAEALVAKGWSVFPQTADGDRSPGTVAGEMIRWGTEHDLINRLPSKKALQDWITYCAGDNVAGVMGPGSHYALTIDVDVTDPVLTAKIAAIAKDVFGKTPFKRIGKQPKFALIYRRNPSENIKIQKRHALDGGHAIELLSDGVPLTFYGRHHLTGMPFKWYGKQPHLYGPEIAPIITQDMINQFWFEVDEIMPIEAPQRLTNGDGMNIEIVENGDGQATDGRVELLKSLSWNHFVAWKRKNKNDSPSEDAVKRVITDVMTSFSRKAVMNGRWTPEYLRSQAVQKVRHLFSKPINISTGLTNKHIGQGKTDREELAKEPFYYWKTEEMGDPRAFEPPDLTPIITQMRDKFSEFLEEANRPALNYGGVRLSSKTKAMDDIPSLRIIKAPPGFGKTTSMVEMIAADPATYRDIMDDEGNQRRFPFVMLVPTYRNAEELRTRAAIFNLDHTASDEELAQAAEAVGLIEENALPTHVEQIRAEAARADVMAKNGGNEFIVSLYQGRLRAGCLIPDQMSIASEAGISTSSLCQKKKEKPKNAKPNAWDDGETEEFCEHYHVCPAIAQRQVFGYAHLVIMPHAFLGLPIPPEAQYIRAVIVDERVHDMFLHTSSIPTGIFDIIRKDAKPTKAEYIVGLAQGQTDAVTKERVAERLRSFRMDAAQLALMALQENKCPAEALFKYDPHEALNYAAAGKRLCAASMRSEASLKPNMSVEEIEKVVKAPTGEYAKEEWRFWSIVEDRIKNMSRAFVMAHQIMQEKTEAGEEVPDLETGTASLDETMALLPEGFKVRGQKEARIQLRHHLDDAKRSRDRIRLSWRTVPNWINRPLLLLDASAAPEIIAKVWGRSPEQVEQVDLTADAKLYERLKVVLLTGKTYSNTFLAGNLEKSYVGSFDQEPANIDMVRKIISYLSVKHGSGRVVVGATMMVRRLLNTNWMAPGNTDWCHYGALRGIDAFKNHEAALSIGRIEVPIDVMDGIAAALTYDDNYPEEPFDRLGTGCDEQKRPLRLEAVEKHFALRDGGTTPLNIPCYPDTNRWCQILQKQYREEEILQFLGRLRAFYSTRKELPVWYALSSVLPEGVIIDQIAKDFGGNDKVTGLLVDAIRQNFGVITPTMSDAYPKVIDDDRNKQFKHRGLDFDGENISSPIFSTEGAFNEDGPYTLGYITRDFNLPKPDKIDAELGSLFERRKLEFKALEDVISSLKINFDVKEPWTIKHATDGFVRKDPVAETNVVELDRARKIAKISSKTDKEKADHTRQISAWLALSALETYWKVQSEKTNLNVSTMSEGYETVDFSAYGDMLDPLEYIGDSLASLTG
jgi:hypothetical protein